MEPQQFLNNYPESELQDPSLLESPAARERIYRMLHPKPNVKFLPLLRTMLLKEVAYRADETTDGTYFENLYWVGLFLYQIGDLDDVIPMWQAKQTNMDTGGGFDVQFLVGQGVSETLGFLQHSDSPCSKEAFDYISQCNLAGDFETMDAWFAERIEYFSGS